MPFPVTAIFAGMLAMWLIYLQFKVIGHRRAKQISLGDGGDEMCARAIRAHGNAAETVPIFLILMAAGESLGTPVWVLVAVGLMFGLGRVLHGVHFLELREKITLRFYGMLLTVIATALMALGAIGHGLGSLV